VRPLVRGEMDADHRTVDTAEKGRVVPVVHHDQADARVRLDRGGEL
jgi:hypothetical protein